MNEEEKSTLVKIVLDFVKETDIQRLIILVFLGLLSFFIYTLITDNNRAERFYAFILNRNPILEKKVFLPTEGTFINIICLDLICIPHEDGLTVEIERQILREQNSKFGGDQ